MSDEDQLSLRRRALIALALGGGIAGLSLSSARSFLDRFAPLSGSVWASASRDLSGPIDSPYGAATVRYDDYGVPHVDADDEAALYYAVGYVQANDRLFQMDVLRRRMRGRLSELAGPSQLESDRFNLQMDFVGAAETTWEAAADTDAGRFTEAYADGVNDFRENEELPFEFRAAEYEPDPWTPVDTILQQKQISWGLTGDFGILRLAAVRERLGQAAVEELYPARYDFDQPIVRPDRVGDGDVGGVGGDGPDPGENGAGGLDPAGNEAGRLDSTTGGDPPGSRGGRPGHQAGVDRVATRLSAFEWPEGVGSNSWVVGPEHTSTGRPIVCNDTHLLLSAPPVWYEMHLDAPDYAVRGFTFPGVPLVVIGENEHGAWGFTNSNADVIDFYEYEVVDGGAAYRYRGERREFDTETREIEVSGAENETVEVRKTVHGTVLERAGQRVGVAWTGHGATRTTTAILELARSEGIDDALDAAAKFDEPSQNFVYADRDGRCAYHTVGKIPIRRIDGDPVAGTRIFDGSAGEAEWEGFEPFGDPDWEGDGFVPFEEMPSVVDPSYVATANQRIADDPTHYLAASHTDPFRGIRAYELLDGRVREDGEAVTPGFAKAIQRDTFDGRASRLVPAILAARDRMSDRAREAADALADWDYHMDRGERAPLVFERFFHHFRRVAFADDLAPVARAVRDGDGGGSGEDDPIPDPDEVPDPDLRPFLPSKWVTATLPASSDLFDGDRAGVIAEAMDRTASELREEDWETYGDYSTADFSHPLGSQLSFLNYPDVPTPGSSETLRNFHTTRDAGTSQRLVALLAEGGEGTEGVLPGGNSGDYFSDHYADQLRMWAGGDYRSLSRTHPEGEGIRFRPAGDGG